MVSTIQMIPADRLSAEQLLNILMLSPDATAIYIGQDIIIQMANDRMIHFWGKDRSIIGKPLAEAVPELKGQPFIGLLQEVWRTGQTFEAQDQPAILSSGGKLETSYYDFTYQAMLNSDGHVFCILHTARDVTELNRHRVQLTDTEQALRLALKNAEEGQERTLRLYRELQSSEKQFRRLISQAPVAINLFKTRELIIDSINSRMLEIWGKTFEVEGKPFREALPEMVGQPFLAILDSIFDTGIPYFGNEQKATIITDGIPHDRYFNFIYQPIRDEDGSIHSILQVVAEVTDQVVAKLALEKAEEMMFMTISAAKLGSWQIEPATKVLQYNQTLLDIFGYEGKEPMTYEQAINQVVDKDRPVILAAIDKAIDHGGDYDITYQQKRFNDGEVIWLRSFGKVGRDISGELILFSGFVMDITEQKKDEQRKSDFIGMVSHELKTPLSSLSAYVQMLQRKALQTGDSFTADTTRRVLSQTRKMTALINGFLNISRLESGKITIAPTKFAMADLIREIKADFQSINPGYDVILHLEEGVIVNADYDKIGQVLNNLLSNALKYAPQVRMVEIFCIRDGENARVCVKDFGPGITTDEQEKIFDRYYRANAIESVSGFGIGLYLSAEIIQRHHGSIGVESTPGEGAAFYFTLKAEPA